jgi:CRISPR-associated protein Csb2
MDQMLLDRLLSAVDEDRAVAGVSIRGVYRPAADDKVMPPTFPGERPYLLERRRVEGETRGTVVLDQVPSQANRVEEALLAARDKGHIELPLFELQAKEVFASVVRAGYPEPEEVTFSPAPMIKGAPHRPRTDTLPAGRPRRPMVHARVTFGEPVVGPVLVGSMRYFGLGLLVPTAGER